VCVERHELARAAGADPEIEDRGGRRLAGDHLLASRHGEPDRALKPERRTGDQRL
jgi:hypothetical protein